MKMPSIPTNVPEAPSELPKEISLCHMHDPCSFARLCSCPCATLDIAITLAETNVETLNLVEGLGHYSAWKQGAKIFTSTTSAAFAAWKQEHIKPKKDRTSDYSNQRIPNQRLKGAREPRRSTDARDRAANRQ